MRTSLLWLATVIILTLATSLIMYSLDTWSENRARTESRDAALAITRDTLAQWSADTLLEKIDPIFLQEAPEPILRNYIASLRRLGRLQDLVVANADLHRPSFWYWNQEVRADFVLTAYFNGSPTDVEISLVRRDGQWLVNRFLVQASFMAA